MHKFTYPKLKYRAAAAPVATGADYDHVRVADPMEEDALGEGWFDTPGEMRAAALADATPEPATAATPAPTPAPKRKR